MGFALAEECARRGAIVTLIAGPVSLETTHPNIKRIDIESCQEMFDAANEAFGTCDAAILCAAVADFKPSTIADKKIKREGEDLIMKLNPTKDIAASLGMRKKENQILVGFALETNNELSNAQQKLKRKNLNFIVLNSLQNEGTCFRFDNNKISIISEDGIKDYPVKTKKDVAKDIIDNLCVRL